MLRPFAPRFFRPFVAAACLATAALASVVACTDTSSEIALTPISGVIVRSESLTSTLGCGQTGDVMYKYAAVVIDKLGTPRTSGVYDCFADATIVSLTAAEVPADAGPLDFTIQIYAFNKGAYDAQAPAGDPQSVDTFFGKYPNVQALSPTWSVLCEATQQRDVRVLAVCGVPALGKLAFGGASGGPGSIVVPLDKLVGADGARAFCSGDFATASVVAHTTPSGTQGSGLTDFSGTVPCPLPLPLTPRLPTRLPPAPSNAGTASDAGDGGDGGDGEADVPIDAGPPVRSYPAPFTAAGALAPATFTVEVTLRNAFDVPTRATTCTLGTSFDVTTTAQCAPLHDAP